MGLDSSPLPDRLTATGEDGGGQIEASFRDVGGTALPSVLPDISPSRGEIGCPFAFRQSPTLIRKAPPV
ncbi:MAG: hypothetical protein E5Y62_23205 [Mesorhizobium sp.]|nr:MAG: hypothetical protein E5Y62_23205 [Mesorhizobium sp.]